MSHTADTDRDTVPDVSDAVGRALPTRTVVIERGPVSNFADAVKDESPVFRDPAAAAEAGFDAIPAPPTFSFAMHHWGTFPELQPDDADGTHPVTETLGRLLSAGGLILHGEQEFTYHRPILVGDVLTGRGRIANVHTKERGERTMTFVVSETDWSDADGNPVVTTKMTLIHRV